MIIGEEKKSIKCLLQRLIHLDAQHMLARKIIIRSRKGKKFGEQRQGVWLVRVAGDEVGR